MKTSLGAKKKMESHGTPKDTCIQGRATRQGQHGPVTIKAEATTEGRLELKLRPVEPNAWLAGQTSGCCAVMTGPQNSLGPPCGSGLLLPWPIAFPLGHPVTVHCRPSTQGGTRDVAVGVHVYLCVS